MYASSMVCKYVGMSLSYVCVFLALFCESSLLLLRNQHICICIHSVYMDKSSAPSVRACGARRVFFVVLARQTPSDAICWEGNTTLPSQIGFFL